MKYTDLEAWKESRIIVKMVYDCLLSFPKEEIYGLQSQIKRSVISIPSNIAEGCGRSQPKDTIDEITLNILLEKLTRIRIYYRD